MLPIAITTLPVTDVVAQMPASGLLERRLALGLEEIYLTEHAVAVMPALTQPLRDLARRYPQRLALVPDGIYTRLYRSRQRDLLRFRPEAARDYLQIGSYLTEAYEEGYEQAAKALPPLPLAHRHFPGRGAGCHPARADRRAARLGKP